MRKFSLLFACVLILASCSKEEIIAEEAVQEADSFAKSATKVGICHKNAGEIAISESAVQTHIDHGDAVDRDGDGFYDKENPCSAIDCDDTNAAVNPDATEVTYDGIDNDCNPDTLDDDLDEDGYDLVDDCDDANAAVNPGAEEICGDGIDNNCNGNVDEGCNSNSICTDYTWSALLNSVDLTDACWGQTFGGLMPRVEIRFNGLNGNDGFLSIFENDETKFYFSVQNQVFSQEVGSYECLVEYLNSSSSTIPKCN